MTKLLKSALVALLIYITAILPVQAAARFWVGGTGTWDASDTSHWSTTTGGSSGASVPGSSDAVTLDGSSGGGTVTLGAGYNPTVQSITCGAFTGTLDASANNNNVTLNAAAGFNCSGTGTRTVNLGNGTWTISATTGSWTMTTTTNLTFNAGSSTVSFTSAVPASSRTFNGGGLTYNAVSVSGTSKSYTWALAGANTITTLTVSGINNVGLTSSVTNTITTLNITGAAATPVQISASTAGSPATLAVTNASMTWAALRDVTFTGSPTTTNSFDLGGNSGITISPPASATGGVTNNLRPGLQ